MRVFGIFVDIFTDLQNYHMKILTLLFSFIFAFPFALSAQSVGELLPKISEALSAGQNDYAVSLFRQSLKSGPDQTEMFYWTQVDKNSVVAPRLAQEMAAYYKKTRNYDKAYLFYKELLQNRPEDISSLVSCAEMEMMRGKEENAVKLYEKVLSLDADNLQANIFLGNYFYLQAERQKKSLEDNFKKLNTPTKMQYARYRNGLSDVFVNDYSKAKGYLQRVLRLFPSTEAGKTLDKIKLLELELK